MRDGLFLFLCTLGVLTLVGVVIGLIALFVLVNVEFLFSLVMGV